MIGQKVIACAIQFVQMKSLFLSLAFLVSVSSALSAEEKVRIRMMAANITTGNRQSYDNGEGIRIFQGLKPDVVMIQEFRYGEQTKEDIRKFVDTAFGKDFHYYREEENSDDLANGIISRFPLLSSGEWEDPHMRNRDFAWAQIDIPGDKDLWAISVHLSASKPSVRMAQAQVLVEKVSELIPAADYVIIGGDFNTQTRTDKPIEILSKIFKESAPPVDSEGKSETNRNRKKNYDWLLVDSDLEPLMVPVSFRTDEQEVAEENKNTFSNGLVFNSQTFPHLDRLGEVRVEDSIAEGMQHFPVIKDFQILVSSEKK